MIQEALLINVLNSPLVGGKQFVMAYFWVVCSLLSTTGIHCARYST